MNEKGHSLCLYRVYRCKKGEGRDCGGITHESLTKKQSGRGLISNDERGLRRNNKGAYAEEAKRKGAHFECGVLCSGNFLLLGAGHSPRLDGFRVWSLWLGFVRVWGLGFRVSGLGFSV